MDKGELRYIGALVKRGILSGANVVPALIAEVERLEADNARLEKESDFLAKRICDFCPVDAAGDINQDIAESICEKEKCDSSMIKCWRAYARKADAEQEGKDANA